MRMCSGVSSDVANEHPSFIVGSPGRRCRELEVRADGHSLSIIGNWPTWPSITFSSLRCSNVYRCSLVRQGGRHAGALPDAHVHGVRDRGGRRGVPGRDCAAARPGRRPLRTRQGRDVGERPTNADYAVVSEFASVEDFRTYLAHPAHLAVPRGHVRSAHSVQFLVADPGLSPADPD
ncbi:Dabb family protein [Pseudonocardia alni]|uniref:Dabb family protein n=1 Tax=Pseudonocardia alni TaxID=33907 RepID=UPI000C2C869E